MAIRSQQFSYNAGQLDPKLIARMDLEKYYSGAATMKNVFLLPQGGFRRRDGLEYIDTLTNTLSRITSGVSISAPNGGTTGNANDNDTSTELTTTTGISTTNPYVVVEYDLGSAQSVKFVDVEGFSLDTGSVSDEFVVQYSDDGSSWTTLGDPIPAVSSGVRSRRRMAESSHRYWRFARVGSTDLSTAVATIEEFTLWTEDSTVSNANLIEFEFSASEHYALVFSDRNIRVYLDGVRQADVRTPYTSSQLSSIDWSHKLDALILVDGNQAPQQLSRQGGDDEWQMRPVAFDEIPQYQFSASTSTPSGNLTPDAVEGNIKLTAASYSFTSADVGQFVEGNGGRARITQINSSTEAVAVTEIPFYSTDAIAGGDWTLDAGWEDAWSDSRGWPRSVTFYDARMWLGGTSSLPATLWGSRIDDFFNFDLGQFLDDDGIAVTLSGDEVPVIRYLFPGRHLQIFTSSGERWVPQAAGTALTPANISVRLATSHGVKSGLRPREVSGATLFVQREGKALREFLFVDTEQSYLSSNLSLLSAGLVDSPTDMTLRRSTSTDEADYLLLVNQDANIGVFMTLRDQNIAGWAEADTSGDFLNVGIDQSDMYAIVERTLNGSTVRTVERFNPDHLTDSSVRVTSGLPATTISGFDHLEGETIKVFADGLAQDDKTVSGGQITLDREATTSVEGGIDFTPVVTTMPFATQLSDGTTLGRLKRPVEMVLELSETTHLVVAGQTIPFRQLGPAGGGSPLDTDITEYTGQKRVEGLRGYDERGQVTITQSVPGKMTVLSTELKVAI